MKIYINSPIKRAFPYILPLCLTMAPDAFAADAIVVDLGATNTVAGSAKIEQILQINNTPVTFQNIVSDSKVITNLVATAVVNSPTDSNKISAPALANSRTSQVDLVTATNAGGDISLASLAQQVNTTDSRHLLPGNRRRRDVFDQGYAAGLLAESFRQQYLRRIQPQ